MCSVIFYVDWLQAFNYALFQLRFIDFAAASSSFIFVTKWYMQQVDITQFKHFRTWKLDNANIWESGDLEIWKFDTLKIRMNEYLTKLKAEILNEDTLPKMWKFENYKRGTLKIWKF